MPERVSPHAGMSDETLEHHLKRYEFAKKYVKDKVVLSVACGNGYGEHMLATEGGAKKVIGYDISQEAVDFANNNYTANNLEYHTGNVLSLPFTDDSIDVVVSFETIEHIDDHYGYLRELTRILKPEGVAILSTPNKAKSLKNYLSKKPCNKYHVREYLKDEFMSLLGEYFKEVRLLGQKVIVKRRLSTLPRYLLYKLTGKLREIEIRDYDVKPYPRDTSLETAIFVVVCEKS